MLRHLSLCPHQEVIRIHVNHITMVQKCVLCSRLENAISTVGKDN